MFNFPQKISEVKLSKLFIHSIILMIMLTLLVLFSTDVVGLIVGHLIEKNTDYVTPIMLIWIFFALQSNKYRKPSKEV